MDDGAYAYAIATGGTRWHVVPYAWRGQVQQAKCGLVPVRGWARVYSSLDPAWPRCRRCADRE